MAQTVADRGSNKNEQIDMAAELISKSKHRLEVFRCIYRGRSRTKSVPFIMAETKLPRNRVLDAGKKLASHDVVTQKKIDKVTCYEKVDFFQQNRDRILSLAGNPGALARYPTKRKSAAVRKGARAITVQVRVAKQRVVDLTVDDIDSFKQVKKVESSVERLTISEQRFKQGLASLLRERGSFKDWGGELRDLFSSRLVIKGKRQKAAFALKGPGTKGELTPGKMGKNGDQIQRLFSCPADVFVVQYSGQIADSVRQQVSSFADLKSILERRPIWTCVIDGTDSARLVEAYSDHF